jgi:hypothetical protein
MPAMPVIPTYITGAFLGIWLLFFLIGKRQLAQAKQITMDMALSELKPARNAKPGLTVEEYYEILLPKWEAEIEDKIKVILHKTEFWSVPAKVEVVRTRLNFTPEWLGAWLKINKRPLSASEEMQIKIDEIAALSQKLAE